MDDLFREIVRTEIRSVLKDLQAMPAPVGGPAGDILLTIAEAAAIASVSKGTIQNWFKKGLRRHGRGRLVRVARKDLLELLEHPQRAAPLSPEQRASKILGKP